MGSGSLRCMRPLPSVPSVGALLPALLLGRGAVVGVVPVGLLPVGVTVVELVLVGLVSPPRIQPVSIAAANRKVAIKIPAFFIDKPPVLLECKASISQKERFKLVDFERLANAN